MHRDPERLNQQKIHQQADGFFAGGGGRIRTIEAEKQQIYSLPPLATRELSLNNF